jgi:ATP-dependent Clp protease adaptor protein ClpS
MLPEEKDEILTDKDIPLLKKLILYNSNHLWDDVINQLQKATGFDLVHCEQIAVIAHTKGKAVVKSGEYEELIRIDSVLKEINLISEIQ